MSKDSKKRLVDNVSDEAWHTIRVLAIMQNITIGALIEKMLGEYEKKYKTK